MKILHLLSIGILISAWSCGSEQREKTFESSAPGFSQEFKGKIAKTYEETEEW
jgi:hypothetical protein